MFRSYMTVIALACLAATIGCSSSDGAGGAGGGGAGGSGGGGDGGQGGGGAGGSSTLVEDTVTLACTNSFSGDSTTISFLPWIMSIDPGESVEPGAEFTAELTGTAFFDEGFLDAALDVLTTLNRIELTGLAGTVQVRSGGTGADVVLGVGDIPNTCARLDGNGDPIPCDPANDLTDPAGGQLRLRRPPGTVQQMRSVCRLAPQRRLQRGRCMRHAWKERRH